MDTVHLVLSSLGVLTSTMRSHYFSLHRHRPPTLQSTSVLFASSFRLARNFLDLAMANTVEQLQAFGNTRIPSPPWVLILPLTVPLALCTTAAEHLIAAVGGEDRARIVFGGITWFRARAVQGVPGEWIVMKGTLGENEEEDFSSKSNSASESRADNSRSSQNTPIDKHENDKHDSNTTTADNNIADKNEDGGINSHSNTHSKNNRTRQDKLDALPVIYYIHGGAYYFGSVYTHRYSIWRMAKKTKCRAFTINYRLAPQYPFPCALLDCLAGYLYLINPPPGSAHAPVKPEHITLAGDSAGGGLVLSLLTVLRDCNLPLPAGAVLISPWCDLTHSFPSIMENTETDMLPEYGFRHRPSTLWPPPEAGHEEPIVVSVDGVPTKLTGQIQLYATNNQLTNPLVSPVLAYLGGLCPLLFIISDKEVLRDECIYAAHKAARPDQYPIKQEIIDMNPEINSKLSERFGPTKVHVQIYDECCHCLTLFSFIRPARYAYRSISVFAKHVMKWDNHGEKENSTISLNSIPLPDINSKSTSSEDSNNRDPLDPRRLSKLILKGSKSFSKLRLSSSRNSLSMANTSCPPSPSDGPLHAQYPEMFHCSSPLPSNSRESIDGQLPDVSESPELSRNISAGKHSDLRSNSEDVAGTQFDKGQNNYGSGTAGDPDIYHQNQFTEDNMIRQRVSVDGIIRPLEPATDIKALNYPIDKLGTILEEPVKRYLKGQKLWDKKYHKDVEKIEKNRAHQRSKLEKLRKEMTNKDTQSGKNLSVTVPVSKGRLLSPLEALPDRFIPETSTVTFKTRRDWMWSYILEKEKPPPSSIIARRDTADAVRLSKVVDSYDGPESSAHGTKLWQSLLEILSPTK